MPYDVLERGGVVELVEAEKGKYKTAQDAEKAADKLIASNEKAEIAQQDKDDAEAEALSAGEKPLVAEPEELPEPERTMQIIRDSDPKDAVKLTKMAQVREIAKLMDIPTARKKEIDLVTEIKAKDAAS